MNIIKTKKLALAAYIYMEVGKLHKVDKENREFYFESDRSVDEWEMDYLDSCCNKHDNKLVTLRNLLPKRN